jgi:hypothetical protein
MPNPVTVTSAMYTTVTVTHLETDYETVTVTTTDSFSTTSTIMDTVTATLTPAAVTATVVASASVLVTSTSTVATSSGFYLSTGLPAAANKRSLPQSEVPVDVGCALGVDDFKYPRAVVCTVQVVVQTTVIDSVTPLLL